jgi:hypothetical protein
VRNSKKQLAALNEIELGVCLCDRVLTAITEFALSGGSMIDDPVGFSEPANYTSAGGSESACVEWSRNNCF